jgi:5-methyltetrahydrofolate--homocysteine methyltransferase
MLAHAAGRVIPELPGDEAFTQIQEDVLSGRHLEIQHHVEALLSVGVGPHDILEQGMIAAMELISERFKAGDVFIPEVLLSARAMNEALVVLEPHLTSKDKEAGGKILMGTVKGDMHDIGKNMVITMLRGVGFEIKDMGVNLPVEKIIEEVEAYQPHILGLSALLTTTMPEMKKAIDSLDAHGLREKVRVMVGGAPVNQKFALDIGADGYAPDAAEAVDLAKRLIGNRVRSG